MLKDKINLLKKLPSRLFNDQNQFQKIKLIGQGTFGKVYMMINKKTHEKYAVKQVIQDPKYKNRQLSIISQLDHPNIIQMKDYMMKFIQGQCLLFIMMEYMDISLYSLLKEYRKQKKMIDSNKRKIMAFQMMKGLAYLEINNVCHRDLKPPNILLNRQTFELKICDFGSAKIIEKKENNVSYICSRYYRAPELILNSTSYGCQIDMWSAGCIIVQFLTLEPLFPGDSSIEQLIEIIKLLGTPTRQQIVKYSEENAGIQIPKLKGTDWKKVLKRYNPCDLQLDLISKMLTYDLDKRIKPFDALKHPYFADIGTLAEAKKLPFLFQFDSLRNKKNKKLIIQLEQLYQYPQQQSQSQKQSGHDTAETFTTEKSSL